jgi:hypothetical protein
MDALNHRLNFAVNHKLNYCKIIFISPQKRPDARTKSRQAEKVPIGGAYKRLAISKEVSETSRWGRKKELSSCGRG